MMIFSDNLTLFFGCTYLHRLPRVVRWGVDGEVDPDLVLHLDLLG